jgi:hypothetical protein
MPQKKKKIKKWREGGREGGRKKGRKGGREEEDREKLKEKEGQKKGKKERQMLARMQRKEPLCAFGGNVNSCSHNENQYGDSSKN